MSSQFAPTPSPAPRKNRLRRFLAFALLCALTPIFVFGATVAATGTVQIRVHEHGPDGVNLWIPVPAIFFDVALFAAPRMIQADGLSEARAAVEPYLPALRSLASELEAMPNAVLVEVESPDEHVQIVKSFGSFHIEVHDQDTDVSVIVPARLIGSALGIFG